MIVIKTLQRGNEFKISVQGHAGYAESGKDIVCAGVSAITCTLHEYLVRREADGGVVELEAKTEPGDTEVVFYVSAKEFSSISDSVFAILSGYLLIEATYPEHVCVQRG